MGRPLEGKAEAESVIGSAMTLQRVNDLSVKEQKLGARHNIRIHIAMVPRHLYPSTSIKPEK